MGKIPKQGVVIPFNRSTPPGLVANPLTGLRFWVFETYGAKVAVQLEGDGDRPPFSISDIRRTSMGSCTWICPVGVRAEKQSESTFRGQCGILFVKGMRIYLKCNRLDGVRTDLVILPYHYGEPFRNCHNFPNWELYDSSSGVSHVVFKSEATPPRLTRFKDNFTESPSQLRLVHSV